MLKPALLSLDVLVSALILLAPVASAQNLPTFDDFRRVDRLRRATGRFQTEDLFKITQIDRGLIQNVARQTTNNYQIVWGAAELIDDWPTKRSLFGSALALSGTNVEVAIRYACVAVENHDPDTALPLLHLAEKGDSANIVPWFVEWYLLRVQANRVADVKAPPLHAVRYRDYAASAARARIRTLEVAGYSPYSARRIGFMPDTPVLAMVRDWISRPIEIGATPMLLTMARAMQDRPIYLVTELVGQSLELATVAAGASDPSDNPGTPRFAELIRRREEIQALLAAMERNVVDLATESEMIQYFDNVLALGEENAMHHLAQTARGGQPFP